MKTNNKIRILFFSVILILVLFLIGYLYIRNREISIYMQSKHLSDEKVVDNVLDLKAASFLKPTIDNSAWDDMFEFIKTRDTVWAKENFTAILKTFNMNFLSVYDESGKNIFAATDTVSNYLRISENEILAWFKDNKNYHTFFRQDDEIYEIFAAVVVPTYDIYYTTKENGYLVSAKKWDSEYIKDVSKLTGFDMEINLTLQKSHPSFYDNKEIIYRQLKDFQNNSLAELIFSKQIDFQSELSNIKKLLFGGFGVLIITILFFVFFTNKWLTVPLKNIAKSLEEDDLMYVRNLLNKKNEFGDIANLVQKFKEQKEKLIREVNEKTEATKKYKALLEAQPDLMFIFDKDGTYLEYYAPDVSILIDKTENIIGSNLKDYFETSVANNFIEVLRKVSSNHKVEPIEYDINLPNEKHSFEARFVSLGESRILSIVRDVTERRISEEALKNEKRLSDAIIETLPGGFFMTDLDGNYIRKNEFSEKKRFVDIKNEHDDNIFQYVYGEDLLIANKAIQDAKESGRSELELRFEFQTGIIKWFYLSIQRLDVENNSFLIGTSLETTKRKQSEQELIKAKDKAEESERLKTSFLANMSHELRTPMVGILGYSDMLRSELTNGEHYVMAESIFNSGNRLMETLNLILDLSRIEAGKLELNNKIFNISETVKTAVKLYEKLAESKGLRIEYENCDKSITVNLDERLVRDIINNIINNAIKYTIEGEVVVKVNEILIENKPYISVVTKDTGIGIPSDKLDLIFEEFRQVSEGLNRGFEGTGLGLSLTKKFVEKMGGFITVTSELGKGSVFTVTLPSNMDADIKEEIIKQELDVSQDLKSTKIKKEVVLKNEKKRILAVDNDDTTLMLIDTFLSGHYIIDKAKSGEEAIYLARLNKYDLILMDINLGKDDGIYVTKKIREIKGFKNVPVVALTAYAMVGDREKFIKDGLNDYISKPFLKADLLSLISKLLQ